MHLGLILKVLVIGDYCKLWETLKVVALIFESLNDCHEFLVVDFVIMLRCIHCLGLVHNRVPQAVITFLREYPADGEVECIDFDLSGSVRIVQR